MKNRILLIIFIILISSIAGYFIYSIRTVKITSTGDKQIDNLIINLQKSMEKYMKDTKPSYSQTDINECAVLLSDYSRNIFKTHSKEEALPVVKSTILKLNALNEKCKFSLIETNEREQIVKVVILAGNKMGYNSTEEDITEEWREW